MLLKSILGGCFYYITIYYYIIKYNEAIKNFIAIDWNNI
jgi:hypothetical protein